MDTKNKLFSFNAQRILKTQKGRQGTAKETDHVSHELYSTNVYVTIHPMVTFACLLMLQCFSII